MPTGFTTTPPSPSNNTSTVCGLQNYANRAIARGEADFQRQPSPLSITYVGDIIAALPAGVAKAAVDQVQAGLSSCTTFTSTSSGQPITFHVSPLSFPRLDDQTLALRLTGQPQSGVLQGTTLVADVIIIRAGNNLAVVINLGLSTVDSSLTESLATKQATKLTTL
jgi:hypothetical protein